jgi:polyribonucleotide nucleotidyltransferase
LMDAGIKTQGGVSGIAMGMISDPETGKYAILSDILGDEDHLGDMDFKIVGNENGIYACQMDIKIDGLSYEVLEEALLQAKEGRAHILAEMEKTIKTSNEDLKPHTPRIVRFAIEKDKIGAVIGSGGKVIQELQATTNTTISIDEVDGKGMVEVMSANKEDLDSAIAQIEAIIADPVVGETYTGTVKNIMDFGAFVEFMPGKEGLLHISEITWERLEKMEGVLETGEEIQVKLLDVDERSGKFKLSRKVLLEKPEGYVERPPRERRDSRGPRRDNRRPNRGGGDRRNDDRKDRSRD